MALILSSHVYPSFLEQGNFSNKSTWWAKEVMYVMNLQDPTGALVLGYPSARIVELSSIEAFVLPHQQSLNAGCP